MLLAPRRFRRRLLLPLGWVALGCLLPLSCWLLGRQPKQWRRESVMQMTLPPLRPDTSSFSYALPHLDSAEYNPWFDAGSPKLPAKLAQMRPWKDFALLGEAGLDSVSLSGFEAAVKAIQADTGHAGGVRVQIRRQVAYRELVKLLDMMERLGQKKYLLDLVHQPTTFYAITPRPPTLAERRHDSVLNNFAFGPCIRYTQLPCTNCPATGNLRRPARRPQVLLTFTVATLLLATLVSTFLVALGTRR